MTSPKKRKARETGDDVLVARAQARAAISGFLSSNPGEHSVAAVADALKLTRGTAGLHLAKMAEAGLIPEARKEGTSKMYRWSGDTPSTALVASAAHEIKRAYTKRDKGGGNVMNEIELQINGTVVLGRNPITGRLRIQVEANER